jgi:hypothetical protein
MRSNITEDGLYFFPGMGHGEQSPEAMKAWEEKLRAGPIGILVIHPQGAAAFSPRQLIVELITDIFAAFLLALVLTRGAVTVLRGGWWGALLGLFAWLSISASYWNWYGFPSAFVAAEGIDQIVGWFLAGLVISVLMKGSKKAEAQA